MLNSYSFGEYYETSLMDLKNLPSSSSAYSSVYLGITKHRLTGRYAVNLWDETKGKKGTYDQEANAARAFDLAALRYWGPAAVTNFPIKNYERELEEMKNMSKQGYIQFIRRLGLGDNQEEAAKAYDIAAIKLRGENAVTNFDRSRYDVQAIVNGTLSVGRKPKRSRDEVADKESFENMVSLGTSTFCFPGQSSGLVRAGDNNSV
ncbi:AP2-like ethylene-responsive transcription factor AIL6 [Cryptomeria japonica]|uniref:AP2-like ethylene-responsive transcription factor AIL6 n=1 Tax=Cryptomeria japonica TaxID=3369 RepID=UPI0027DA89BC|nr:AP2-like ethylene-responsive transcription factor AIL6 [Cryptomeria japonica]